MGDYYLAIDIGASGGRHILASMERDRMVLHEVHRFENGMKADADTGELCWDIDMLYREVIGGMKKCRDIGKVPKSVGIDTWGVDFVLLDGRDEVIGNAVGYRDGRTHGMDDMVYRIIGEGDLYHRTGIQKMMFNTIYQLMALKTKKPRELDEAEAMLFIPDYLHFLLSGVKCTEYTIATTGQLVSPMTNDWDYELIEMLGYPRKIFSKITEPGTRVGHLLPKIQAEVGFNCAVVLPASHDTGSAVLAIPSDKPDTVYISSGTWSLMGMERDKADCSESSRMHNFTNEGGYGYRYRYLRNIMGLWIIQSIKKEIGQGKSYAEICDGASRECISSIIDCNDDRFMAPASMAGEIKAYCRETGQEVPDGIERMAAVVYNSLAACYGKVIDDLEALTDRKYSSINIMGGGANAGYLNELVARRTNREVLAGPVEATAIGNAMAQMMADGVFKDVAEARQCVAKSFEIKRYRPYSRI